MAGAPAAEQPELWPQGSARGGALFLKEGKGAVGGGADEEVTALSMRLLVCADHCPPPHCQLNADSQLFSSFNPGMVFPKVYI